MNRAAARTRSLIRSARSTQSDNGRGLNVDEVGASLGVMGVLLNRVSLEIQGHLRRPDKARWRDTLPKDGRLTPTYREPRTAGDVAQDAIREIGTMRGHRLDRFLDRLLGRLRIVALNTAVAAIQNLDMHQDSVDFKDLPVLLYHRRGAGWEDGGGDIILVVIDHDPIHSLNVLAHGHPDASESLPAHHHRAVHRHLDQGIDGGSEGLHQVHDQVRFPRVMMKAELGDAGARGILGNPKDHPHMIHWMTEKDHGLMLSRTLKTMTAVV